ncbi:MAG: deoxyribodipyrimidine photolyase [Alphaproteobacteria bacterium]|jgi:deoxyribodipyrimidine photo-lyase|nr:deoxyribodipyrimidine photolyase [Alphaproteobacteria bacterium]
MNDARICPLNDTAPDDSGRFVLYWMQQSQRFSGNHALDYAIGCANERGLGVVVGFGLMDDYPEANERHYAFMLEGLAETAAALEARGMKFVLRRGAPDEVALGLAGDAALVVCDRGYLRHQRAWRQRVAAEAGKAVVEIDGDAVVPVDTASDKVETAARTIRPKLHRLWQDFLDDPPERTPAVSALTLDLTGDCDPGDPDRVLAGLDIDRSIGRVDGVKGGPSEARKRLDGFLADKLHGYKEGRNEPKAGRTSQLSPYLHFGQISAVALARTVWQGAAGRQSDREAFVEQLVVRRELGINFVYYHPDYDSLACLPGWARETLQAHRDDERPVLYDRARLMRAETDDPYWNAAMREMVRTGTMHNYMRMYWGKKILEWSPSPEEAHRIALGLNNALFLDGRDANSFANVAWLFGMHDRAWAERPVYGKVRYMAASGLRRKFDIDAYVRWTETL